MDTLNRYTTIESTDLAHRNGPEDPAVARSVAEHKVYKRRFFGLGQLVLLNIVVSWDVRDNHSLSMIPFQESQQGWTLTDLV